MDFSYTIARLRFRRPWSLMDYGYDGWVHFFGASKSHPPFTSTLNLG